MRIAICNWSRRKVGGTETYLANVAAYLHRGGCELAFFHETDAPTTRDEIPLPDGTPVWCVEEMGKTQALSALRDWKPDVVYIHIIESREIDEKLLGVAPAVFDAHAFYGTCVGGTKCFKFPTANPCTRTFGWKCLVNYYPRRCGGLSPVTMVKRYANERAKNELLPRYAAVITHSDFMRTEYVKHGVPPSRAFNISAGLFDPVLEPNPALTVQASTNGSDLACLDEVKLLFVGRMDRLKGGAVLINALAEVQDRLGRPIQLTFAGEGPARAQWQRRAARVMTAHSAIKIDFVGWVNSSALASHYGRADLLVVPSLWPEPFGRIGLEAGRYGVPSAAFAVGGIPDWLTDGLNGHLAPGDPPSSAGLANAIIRSVEFPVHLAVLRRGALERSRGDVSRGSWPILFDIFERARGEAV